MPARKRPRKGSLGFWPRVRARRIYPRIVTWPRSTEPRPLGFAGYKAGMTSLQVVDSNPNSRTKGQIVMVPGTVLECPPISVFGFRCYASNASSSLSSCDVLADKINKRLARKTALPKASKTAGQMKRAESLKGVSRVMLLCHTNPVFKDTPEIFEVAIGGDAAKQLDYAKQMLGKEIKVSDVFKAGDMMDAVGVTIGKGFQGPVKRFGVKILRRKAQQMQRHTGSLGTTEPSKIRWTVPQSGQLGFFTRTELNKKVLSISDGKDVTPKGGFVGYGVVKGDAMIVEGSVPGHRKRLVRFRHAVRAPQARHPVTLKGISTTSKQGV